MRVFILMLSLSLVLTSCINLKEVNTYSSAALRSLENFEALGSSFEEVCVDNCFLVQLQAMQLIPGSCDCELDRAADSITFVLYSVVRMYFEGLAKLSGPEAVNYTLAPVTSALSEGKFGDLTLDKAQVEAVGKISTILLRAVTDGYRKGKIAQFIDQANGPIQELLRFLALNVHRNLSGKLGVRQQKLREYYFRYLGDTTVSNFERRTVIKEYTFAAREISNQRAKLAAYGKTLDRIAMGHKELTDRRERLGLQATKDLLSQYASEIRAIMGEFNKLKNEN